MLKLAIIGSGDVVRDRHAPLLRKLIEKVRVEGIYTSHRKKWEAVSDALGYKPKQYNNLTQIFDSHEIDAILVAVPPFLTSEITSLSLQTGKHVYAEKPISNNTIEALKLLERAVAAQKAFIVGENFQHQKRFLKLRDLLGDCSKKSFNILVEDYLRQGLRTNPRTGPELVWEHVVHATSAIRSMVQVHPKTIYANLESFDDKTVLNADIEYENNSSAKYQLTVWQPWSKDDYFIQLSENKYHISHRYNDQSSTYTDTITHKKSNSSETILEVIKNAPCGMDSCWSIFLKGIESSNYSLCYNQAIASILDVHLREAMQLSISTKSKVPIQPLKMNLLTKVIS